MIRSTEIQEVFFVYPNIGRIGGISSIPYGKITTKFKQLLIYLAPLKILMAVEILESTV